LNISLQNMTFRGETGPLSMLHACPALPRVTWPTTVSSSPTPVLSGTAPGYLADDCLLVADACVVRHCPRLPGRRLSPRRRRPCQTLEQSLSVGRATVLETGLLPPQDHNLEQSVAQSHTLWALIRPVQAVTVGAFIQTVRPRRSVNCFFTATNRNILTYLLTY